MRLLVVTVVALLLAGCTLGTATQDGPGFLQGAGAVDLAPADRAPAPEISGETLDGEFLSLSQLEGPVVINFWASWCGPCAEEAPDLVAIAEEYGPRGVAVVGVNVKDSRVNAQSFARDFKLPYPSWYDESSQIAAQFAGVQPEALPTTILLDAEHRVAARLFGAVTAAQLSLRLEALLAEAEP